MAMEQKPPPPQQAHALVMPWPGQGHINPMMHLCRKLAASGITITFVNTQYNHCRLVRSIAQQCRKNGTAAPAAAGDSAAEIPDLVVLDGGGAAAAPIRLLGIPDGLTDLDYILTDVQKICQGLIDMTDRLAELADSLRPPLTCVVADVFAICTPAVARRLHVPHVAFWTQSAASFALHFLFTRNAAHFKEMMVDENSSRPIVGIPGCPALKPTEVVTFLQSCDPSVFLFKCLTENFGEELMKHTHVVFNTIEPLEPEALAFVKGQLPQVLAMGPILPPEYVSAGICEDGQSSSLWEEDEGCVEWLDQQEEGSVLYVSFGSIMLLSGEQVTELAAGLEASGSRILMVVRRALVYGKDAVFPEGFTKSGRVHFVDWAPQLAVLAHSAVGGFLTHCGWNSMTEAITNGIPMLCWPYFGDQMMNCRGMVEYWRIGLELEEGSGDTGRDGSQSERPHE